MYTRHYQASIFFVVLYFLQTAVHAAIIATSNTLQDSNDVYEVGKPAKLQWRFQYTEKDIIKFTNLLMQTTKQNNTTEFIMIATSTDGLNADGERLLKNKANVTISHKSVDISFPSLSYGDEFNFEVKVVSGQSILTLKEVSKSLSIENVRGGVSECGNSPIQENYLLEEGNQTIQITLCGNPEPILRYRLSSQQSPLATHCQPVKGGPGMCKYDVELRELSFDKCGERIFFEAEGFKRFEAEPTITLKYKPTAVREFQFFTEIQLDKNGREENCTTLAWLDQSSLKCNISYTVELFDSNMKRITVLNTTTTFHRVCNNTIINNVAFANVRGQWMDNFGDKFEKPVAVVIKQRTRTTTSTTSTTKTTSTLPTTATTRRHQSSSTAREEIVASTSYSATKKPISTLSTQVSNNHKNSPTTTSQIYVVEAGEEEEREALEPGAFIIPGILAMLILVLIVLVFIIYHLKKRCGVDEVDGEYLNSDKKSKKFKPNNRKNSYDLV